MLQNNIIKQKSAFIFLMLLFAGISVYAQKAISTQPTWWFGESGAANFNTYRGTTQMLNQSLSVPAAFHKGDGVKPYFSLLTEYRPGKVWGGMLNLAYDNRGGEFKQVLTCNCTEDLKSKISYISIEPSLRVAPFASALYLFAGPTIGFNLSKAFTYKYTQPNPANNIRVDADFSNIRSVVFSGQAGAGIDIPISSPTNTTQWVLSPFASFQTDFGSSPRSVESWPLYTVRAGIALKFGVAVTVTEDPAAY